jgi:hypothetical protein
MRPNIEGLRSVVSGAVKVRLETPREAVTRLVFSPQNHYRFMSRESGRYSGLDRSQLKKAIVVEVFGRRVTPLGPSPKPEELRDYGLFHKDKIS